MKDDTRTRGTIVDGHVHFHSCFDTEVFLSAALENLSLAARKIAGGRENTSVLLFAETPQEHAFQRLLGRAEDDHQKADGGRGARWTVARLPSDRAVLLATDDRGNTLTLIAGRQIVTSEGLEVLALATDGSIQSGQCLEDAMQMINSMDGIAVLPWGVGKWLGRRGEVIRRYIESADKNTVFLGDISGRPSFWPRSGIFRLAESRGIRVLPGTDPLRLPSEATRAGACCFHIDRDLSRENPRAALKSSLRNDNVTIDQHTRRERLWRFFYNQLCIRMRREH